MFPEATISQSFTLKAFKSGAARLAQEAGVPLLPMALWGTQRMWTKGRPRQLGRHRFPITLRIGAPLTADPDEKPDTLTDRLRARVQELLETAQHAYPARPQGPKDSWWLPAHLGGTAPTPEEAAAASDRDPGRTRRRPRWGSSAGPSAAIVHAALVRPRPSPP